MTSNHESTELTVDSASSETREEGVTARSVPVDDRRSLVRGVLGRPVWTFLVGLLVGSVVVHWVGVAVPPLVRYAPLAVSVVLFGLPHGAVDHLVPDRLGATETDSRGALRGALLVGATYAVFGVGYAFVWFRAPTAAALLFVAMTWFHWGQGDLYVLVQLFAAPHLRSRALRAATLVVRGGLPMLVPLLFHPGRYRAVLAAWVDLFGVGFHAGWLFALWTRTLLGVGFALLTVGTLAAGRWSLRRTTDPDDVTLWRFDALEVALLWAVFAVVPPLVAVGTYFVCWHAPRHVARLVLLDERAVGGGERNLDVAWAVRSCRRFARDAAPLTLLSLVLLLGFAVVVPATVRTPEGYAAAYLVFVSLVTLPHVVVVTWMDHRERLWTEWTNENESESGGVTRESATPPTGKDDHR